ncbi:N/A [soil metagenome]
MADNERPDHGPTTGLAPYLMVRDKRAAEALEFYKEAFGADERLRSPAQDGERLMHAHILVNGASILLCDEFPEFGHKVGAPEGVTIHLQVDDADAWWRRAKDAGATVSMEIADMFWGDRYGMLRDPFGFSWSIGSTNKT